MEWRGRGLNMKLRQGSKCYASILFVLSYSGCMCYSFRGLNLNPGATNVEFWVYEMLWPLSSYCCVENHRKWQEAKLKLISVFAFSPPTSFFPSSFVCKRLNFKKGEFSYFFWSTSKATNRHMWGARTRLVKEVTFGSHSFLFLKPVLAFINTESINLKFEFHFMHPLWLLRLKA